LGAALAATMRMVHGVHRHAAHGRAAAEPANPTGLPERDVLVLQVAHLTDRGAAPESDPPQLARGKLQQGVVALLRHQLDRGARAPSELAATTLAELHVVHHRPERNARQRKTVPRLDVRAWTGLHAIADRQTERGKDVA